MKVLGLIVEYNPFHNGHLYHLKTARELSGADYTVCVMSGNFIQRGEPAIVNKWARAKMALSCGIDLVVELPSVYSMATAEFFAQGAVNILDGLGVIDCICFGSENGRIDELETIAGILSDEPQEYKCLLKESLNKGLSYPAAREEALTEYFKNCTGPSYDCQKILKASNNILGIEYLKALKRKGSTITPLTIDRIGNAYGAEHMTGSISSATAIRKSICESMNDKTACSYKKAMPECCTAILEDEFLQGRGPVFTENFDRIILAFLRKASLSDISSLPYVSEGLENRLMESANRTGSIAELLEKVSTRRYPSTRIQRIIFSLLTGIKASQLEEFNLNGGPGYARVLGFNKKGRTLLSVIKKKSVLPIVMKAADFKNSPDRLIKSMLEIEAQATDIYVLGYNNPKFRASGQEFTQNIVRLN